MKDVKVILKKQGTVILGSGANLWIDGEHAKNCMRLDISIDASDVVTVNGFMVESLTVLMEDEDERIKGLEARIRDDYGAGSSA